MKTFLGDGTIFWGGRHGRDDFLGGTAREFKRFRKAAGGFTINSVGTRLNEAHQDLAGFRKRSRREGNSVRNEPA